MAATLQLQMRPAIRANMHTLYTGADSAGLTDAMNFDASWSETDRGMKARRMRASELCL